jgi:hypothetical protein
MSKDETGLSRCETITCEDSTIPGPEGLLDDREDAKSVQHVCGQNL